VTRLKALSLYAAATVPFGILVHLSAEAAALQRGFLELVCSPLHAYLGVLALASLGLVGFLIAGKDVRRRGALLAKALPFHGHGTAFILLTAALQFGFAISTELAEGDPLAAGSLITAFVAGLVASVLGALVLHAVRSRAESLVTPSTRVVRLPYRRFVRTSIRIGNGPYFAFVAARGNRPPPLL
jgi:hypothetical protein